MPLDNKDSKSQQETNKITPGEAFQNMYKSFQAQIGIAMSDITNLYTSQFKDMAMNFGGSQAQIVELKKIVEEKNARIQELENQLSVKHSSKVQAKPKIVIKSKPKQKKKK